MNAMNYHGSKAIAQRVKQAREAAGFSQKDMAKRLGLTEAGYGHYERDRQTFTVEQLLQVSRILGRPVEWFLGLDTGLSEDEGQLLALYRAIDSEQGRRLAVTLVRDAAAVEYNFQPDQPPASRSS